MFEETDAVNGYVFSKRKRAIFCFMYTLNGVCRLFDMLSRTFEVNLSKKRRKKIHDGMYDLTGYAMTQIIYNENVFFINKRRDLTNYACIVFHAKYFQ